MTSADEIVWRQFLQLKTGEVGRWVVGAGRLRVYKENPTENGVQFENNKPGHHIGLTLHLSRS